MRCRPHALPLLEDEKCGYDNDQKADRVIPLDILALVENGKPREDDQGC
jgi:hypothetical protein